MIASKIAGKWKDHLEGELPSGWTAYQGGADVVRSRPCVIVSPVDAEEDELLRGHYVVTIELRAESVPAATSLADFESALEVCECLGTELWTAQAATAEVARTMDARATPPVIDTTDKLRVAEMAVELAVQARGREQGSSTGIEFNLLMNGGCLSFGV